MPKSNDRRLTKGPLIWPFASLMLLFGVMVEHQLYGEAPADSQFYHQAIAAEVDQLPYSLGDWVGRDIPVPPAAVRLLKANTVFNRQFTNVRDGALASVLLVHCSYTRDIIGHYPPVCYPAQGWVETDSQPVTLRFDGRPFEATQYTFTRESAVRDEMFQVINFMVLPDGRFAADMDEVTRAAQDYQRKFLGVAQVQVILSPQLPQSEKDAVADQFVDMLGPVFRQMWSGDAL